MKTPATGVVWVVAQSVLLLALVAAGPVPSPAWHSPVGIGLGFVLILCSGALGITGVVQLGGNRTPFPKPRPGSRLVRHGVYGWVRHPLYLSLLLAGLSWTLLWQTWPAAALALLQVPFFVAKSRAEERWLRQQFPDYADYSREVPALVPRLRKRPRSAFRTP